MSVSIKVAIRCRPYTIDDKLGVFMLQNAEEDGEVNLINSTYSTTRFAFSWSWWSAYGWQKHQQGNENEGETMKLVNSEAVYESCGVKIKGELLDGACPACTVKIVVCVIIFYVRAYGHGGANPLAKQIIHTHTHTHTHTHITRIQ